jgi:hypothetical protein
MQNMLLQCVRGDALKWFLFAPTIDNPRSLRMVPMINFLIFFISCYSHTYPCHNRRLQASTHNATFNNPKQLEREILMTPLPFHLMV